MIGRLKAHPSHRAVEKLTVADVDKVPNSAETKWTPEPYWIGNLPKQLAFLCQNSSFDRLSCIEMTATFCPHGCEDEILARLGDMRKLSDWVHCGACKEGVIHKAESSIHEAAIMLKIVPV
ncbi:hypothetical protein FRC10_001960 [Ceratobasidium sp. 414]|nr:hypothetical protein FRC10_001960 [Ceratobasidium sp. 414]